MADPIETYRWHKQFAEAWTEKRPTPLDMSDKEVLDWLGEHAGQVVWSRGTDEQVGCWNVYCEELDKPVSARTMREAVKLAAAKLKEMNE